MRAAERCPVVQNGRRCTGLAYHADSMNATPHTFEPQWVVPPATITVTPPRDLFADLEPPAPPVAVKPCAHRHEEKTETDFGEPWGVRMTWTCVDCGNVRGRV